MRSSSRNKQGKLTRASRLNVRDWIDVAIAVKELAIARATLSLIDVEELLTETHSNASPARSRRLIKRVGMAIGRAHHRVPWRADCLVQALAAQRWLARHNLPTSISLGVKRAGEGSIDAHAWLTCGELVVTGGDVAPYRRLEPASPPGPQD
ncbi:lasso peptide biosynthesis B2 protein [Sphingomonas hankyongi]|uniref:lasso peptide biosynthesis B2 protein n=1 Tax=Sphingomonas hankyongi TaxID=2908209 RepID=UPI003D344D62